MGIVSFLSSTASTYQPVVEALTNGVKSIVSNSLSAMGSIIPEALTVMGVTCLIGIGISTFRKIAH